MTSDYEILGRLVLAAVLGAAVGFEREVHGRPAGIRTYLLLCMGSALIMVVSEMLFFKYEGKGLGMSCGPTRDASPPRPSPASASWGPGSSCATRTPSGA